MRKIITILSLSILSITLFAAGKTQVARNNALNLRHGVNMSYRVSQCPLWPEDGEPYYPLEALDTVAALGFDHIRLPIDEHILFDDSLNRRDYTFAEVHRMIKRSLDLNMNVVIDLHTIKSHVFDGPKSSNPLFTSEDAQDRLYRMWQILSEEFHEYPLDRVAYEILNEPATVIGIDGADRGECAEKWNSIQHRCYDIIREREPRRIILLTADQWQAFYMVAWMWVPENDPNIMLAMHYYEPMQITHYNIRWSGVGKYRGKVHYPGPVVTQADLDERPEDEQEYCKWWTKCVYDRDRIAREVDEALVVALRKNLPLYCSEFGVSDNVQSPDRETWFDDVTSVMEERGIGHASWEYRGTWGIISEKNGQIQRFMLPDPNIRLK